jgi:hypothetical protein
MLARADFGLVTGNATGVDLRVARAFCAELQRHRRNPTEWYCQLALPILKRGGFLLFPGYRAAADSTIRLKEFDDWIEEAITRTDAAIMIGGWRGALHIARRFIILPRVRNGRMLSNRH